MVPVVLMALFYLVWPITFTKLPRAVSQHVRTTTLTGSFQGDKFRAWESPALYSASWSQPPQVALPGIGRKKEEGGVSGRVWEKNVGNYVIGDIEI